MQGVGLTFIIALIAKYLGELSIFKIMGQLVLAILLGMLWRMFIGIPRSFSTGVHFSSKSLLRLGIILLGMRLNLMDIIHAGPKVVIIAVINIIITIFIIYHVARWLKVGKNIAILTACGTAICGAAAVVAIASQIKANDDETAIGAASVAILGTIFTIIYTIVYPVLGLSPYGYGFFSGATLHEIAHVLAATAPFGKTAVDIAVIVKLTRVVMLVPIAFFIGIWSNFEAKKENRFRWKSLPIPWFILGFLAMSMIHTLHVVSDKGANQVVDMAYILIAMAMAGLGLNVSLGSLKSQGTKTLGAGLIGSILLSVLGYTMVHFFHLK
ncbi:YeiH family protein [Cytobacillus sp. Hz8]|uniref:YeiH family protein n=1 Tax=Cytobacillus sp. Hz8 TaxID=3347168 RepID=UPI0035D7BEE8